MARESHYVRRLLGRLKELGGWWTRIEQKAIRGTPDILGCLPCRSCGHGRIVAIEAKGVSGKASAIQDHTLEAIRKAGGFAELVVLPNQENELIQMLEQLMEGIGEWKQTQ